MKKIYKVLIPLSILALTGCSLLNPSEDNAYDEGVVTSEDAKEAFSGDYRKSLENEGDIEENGELGEEDPNENEDEDENNEEEDSEEEESSEEVEEFVISSYHMDYTMNYALTVSINDVVFEDANDSTVYSVDYQKTEDDFLLKANLVNNYKENEFDFGSQEIDLHYQDKKLYTEQSVTSDYMTVDVRRAYNVDNLHHLHSRFGDYFISLYNNALFNDKDLEETAAVIDELLANDEVVITSVDGDIVTSEFTYDNMLVRSTIDTKHKLFTHLEYVYLSNSEIELIDETYGDDVSEENSEDQSEEAANEDSSEGEDEADDKVNKDDHKHHDDHNGHNDFFKVNIDKFEYSVIMNFSYNETTVTPLTEEETANYLDYSTRYADHYSDKNHDEEKSSYHGGHH